MDLNWDSLAGKLDDRLLTIAKKRFKKMTPVQAATIPLFLGHKDVTVEAVTGSGKTLSFLLPLLQVVLRKNAENLLEKKRTSAKYEPYCVVVSPTRELASQIYEVLEEFLNADKSLATEIKGILFVGGSNPYIDEQRFVDDGASIIVSTPGRLCDLFSRSQTLKTSIRKCLEIFILDEADQLLALGFEKALNQILSHLPKQRRTGLFSATQTKQLEQLIRAGLRNPVNIEIKAKSSQKNQKICKSSSSGSAAVKDNESAAFTAADCEGGSDGESRGDATQTSGLQMSPYLDNSYMSVDRYVDKLVATLRFLTERPKSKFLIFFATCAQVDYFSKCLQHFATVDGIPLTPSNFFKIHRKVAKKRQKIFERFRDLPSEFGSVLLCTDVMSRGIDFPNVDWVIHFDLPNTLQHYIHRSGRSGHQVGQKGNSLLLILNSEMPFVELCLEKGISLRPVEQEKEKKNSSDIEENNDIEENKSDSVIEWLKCEARKDPAYYELGMKAFVSFVRSYSSCNILSQALFESLDVVELINSYGLLKIPRMPELKSKLRSCRTKFNKTEGDRELADQYKDQLHKARPVKTDSERTVERKQLKQKLKVKRQRMKNKINFTKLKGKQKRELIDDLERNELNEDARVVKKLKRGKINDKQFEEHFGI